MVKKIVEPPKPYVWQKFPTFAKNSEGIGRICKDPEDYERHTGIRVDEMGNPVDLEPEQQPETTPEPEPDPQPEPVGKPPHPPTLETVMAAGYAKEVAEKIVDEEAAKARRGEKPYGDKEPEEFKFQTGGEPVGPVAEAAALGTTPEDLKELRQMASAGEPLVKPRGKKSAAPVQSGELAKEGGW